jgi:hypothetical protein
MKDKDPHIEQELQENPLLGSLKDSGSPFQLPEGYFENFATRLQAEQEEQAFLDQLPGLQSAGKESVFQVPEAYFDQLPQKMQAQTGISKSLNARTRPIRYYRWPVAIAASFALLMGLGLWQQSRIEKRSDPFAGFSEGEVLEALELQDLETDDLLAMLDGDDLVDVGFYEELDEAEIESLLEGMDADELLDGWQ